VALYVFSAHYSGKIGFKKHPLSKILSTKPTEEVPNIRVRVILILG
jgi:hypothetical protein